MTQLCDFALRTKVEIGEQVLAEYSYAEITNYLTALEYGNDNSVEYEYDAKGRLLKQTYEDGDTVTYTYDNNGALATVTDSATGIKTTYYYDFTDRMMKYVESGTNYSHSVGYEYDNINNLKTQVETINGVDRTTSYTYDEDNRVTSKQTGNTKVTYAYDNFSRVTTQTTYNGENVVLTEAFTYNGNSSQIAAYATTAGGTTKTYTYEYDGNGNITSIANSTSSNDVTYTTSYVYDTANQLVRENNQEKGYTHTWTYDNAGNILERKEYAYTTGDLEMATATATVSYVYDTGNWKDLLKSYNNSAITYDEIGNPEEDGTWTYDWQHGRQLARMAKQDSSVTWDFAYNVDGLRLSRSNGSTTYSYVYNGSQLTSMTVGSNTLYFSYDVAGTPMSVKYGNDEYYYTSNIQGDVIGIVDSTGATVVTYTYDAWGKLISTTDTTTNNLGTINPLRYRGYVYDQETGLYYLQSRYYNPEIGRFINADGIIVLGEGLLGTNMFAYCLNNPINGSDPCGMCIHRKDFWNDCSFCAGKSTGERIYYIIVDIGTRYTKARIAAEENIGRIKDDVACAWNQVKAFAMDSWDWAVDFMKSDDYKKIKSGTRMISGAKDVGQGVSALFVPDPTPVNDVVAVYKITFGMIKAAWGFAEFLGEVIKD